MSRFEERTAFTRLFIMVIVTTLICVVLIAVAEIGVRIRHYAKFGSLWGIEDTYTTDSKSGLRIPVPNGRFGPITINSLGFRSPEITASKPPNVLRIAFLGGSTTYCAEVSSNALTWPSLVVDQLRNSRPDRTIDYINAGVPGYGVSMSLRNLRFRVSPLHPDVIIIYHATNDLSSNSFALAIKKGITTKRTEKGMLWPSRYSLLWYLVEKNLMVRSRQNEAYRYDSKLKFEPRELARPFRKDLSELVEASKKVADTVILITFSTRLRDSQSRKQQVAASVTSLYYMPYMSVDGLLSGFLAYNNVIREVAAAEHVELIEAARAVPGDARNFKDSVHFSDAGSMQMARIVANRLTQILGATK